MPAEKSHAIGASAATWRKNASQHVTAMQARDRRAFRAVDLEREQVIAPHARRPGARDGAENAAFGFDQRRRRILDHDAIALAPLVDSFGRGGPRARRHAGDTADESFDHVAPVRVHVEKDAAAMGAIVPARPLAALLGAVEHPPAEFELEGNDTAEIASRREGGE